MSLTESKSNTQAKPVHPVATTSSSVVASASGKVKDVKKKKPTAATVVKRSEAVANALSRYTGLPKGPGSAEEQDKLLVEWQNTGHEFVTVKQIARERERLKASNAFHVPDGAKRVKRRREMIALMSDIGIILSDDDICTLALGRGKYRRAYWICCSLIGNHKRSLNVSKTEALTTVKEGDSSDVIIAKQTLRAQAAALSECQREWQRKVETLREANAQLLSVMESLVVSTDELRDIIAQPPILPDDVGDSMEGEGDGDESDDTDSGGGTASKS